MNVQNPLVNAMNELAALNVSPGQSVNDSLQNYTFRRANQMMCHPWRVKAAITGETVWYGAIWWSKRDGGEDLDALEEAANAKLDTADLTSLERADVEAALSAIDYFRGQRANAED